MSCERQPVGALTKTWKIAGMLAMACLPTTSGQVGTSRQPATISEERSRWRVRIFWPRAMRLSSGEKNTSPEANRSVRRMPLSAATSRRKGSGNCSMMPQPSPDLPSAATAPRWVSRARLSSVVWTSQWLFCPSMCASRAKPQLSRKSRTGSCNLTLRWLNRVSCKALSGAHEGANAANYNLAESRLLCHLIF